jgi:hypothetical protein
MSYIPIKIYPNGRSVYRCVLGAAFFLLLAVVAVLLIRSEGVRLVTVLSCLAGFVILVLRLVAVMRRQPMLKIMDDRFSVYTPFGYAMVRFGEVLAFRKGGAPLHRTLVVVVNGASRPRFQSAAGRLLHCLARPGFANTVSIRGFMLGADLESVIGMLERRRLAAAGFDAREQGSGVMTPLAG